MNSGDPRAGYFRAPEHVLYQEVEGESVLLDLETETYFGVNGVGTRIWQLLMQGRKLPDAVAQIASEYAVDVAMVRRDADLFVGDLIAAGLLCSDD